MSKAKMVVVLFISVFLISCSSYLTRYSFKTAVKNSKSEKLIYQEKLFGRYNHYFENDDFKLYMDIEPYAINFQLQNISEKPIRIIWDSIRVVLDYERIYKISKNLKNYSDDFLEINWQIKKDFIFCSFKNKTQNKMLFEKDGSLIKIGEEIRYNISDLTKSKQDKFSEISWQIKKDTILCLIANKTQNKMSLEKDSGFVKIGEDIRYDISDLSKNNKDKFAEIDWEIKKDTILCIIKNKTKNKMLFEKDSGYVKIGEEVRYDNLAVPFENYKDDFIKINWSVFNDSASITLLNLSKYAYELFEDDGRICFNKSKEFRVIHKNLKQEKLILPDSNDKEYNDIRKIIEMQKSDSSYTIRPSIILPHAIYSDEIASINNSFYPYSANNKDELEFLSKGFINSKMMLIIPICIDNEIKYYNFPFIINGCQILKRN
ncbi:MAG: hypothetical protein GXX85_06375 [Ignavibacteria bacterium]|nr:hypothetical protein [Ignavibacteria bacterium]